MPANHDTPAPAGRNFNFELREDDEDGYEDSPENVLGTVDEADVVEEEVEVEEDDANMDSGEEEDTRMCELCNTRQPISATTLVRRDHANQPMNGYGCRDSAACKVRAVPAARVVRQPAQFRK